MAGAHHLGGGHQGRFFGAAGRQHQLGVDLLRLQRQAGGQRAPHGAQFAGQRQFARELIPRQLRAIDLPAGREDAQGNGEVEAAGILGQVGRGEIDGNALVGRELQPRVLQRRAHAFAGFFDLDLSETYQGEAGQAIGQVHFNGDRRGLQPHKRATLHQSKTHEVVSPQMGAFYGLLVRPGNALHQLGAGWRARVA
jgi:hypothetical protein